MSVYFIVADEVGRVKIGTSVDAARRLKTIASMSPVPLRLAAVTNGHEGHEAKLHERFASARLHGEWFVLTPEIKGMIEALEAESTAEIERASAARKRARLAQLKQSAKRARRIDDRNHATRVTPRWWDREDFDRELARACRLVTASIDTRAGGSRSSFYHGRTWGYERGGRAYEVRTRSQERVLSSMSQGDDRAAVRAAFVTKVGDLGMNHWPASSPYPFRTDRWGRRKDRCPSTRQDLRRALEWTARRVNVSYKHHTILKG